MAIYFRDFVKGLSSHMILLTTLKKRNQFRPFRMTGEGRDTFVHIKRFSYSSYRCFNKGYRRCLIVQLENGFEKPVIFLSRILSDYALGNHGVGTLCFRILCERAWSLSIGKAFDTSYGSQELGLSI